MTRVLWLTVLVCVVQCLPMSQDELEDFSNFLLKTSSLDIHVKSADPDDSYDEDEVVSDHAWEESGKFEGDLILNDRQRRLIVENVEGLSRNGLTDSTKRWPNNEVIYFIQKEHFTSGQVQAIKDGIDDLAGASCVKFRPYRKGDRDAVVIQGSRRGCFSQVGYQGGYQVLNLSGRHPVGRGCFRHGTVIHELLHSLGFYHMQSSPDRDDYINVVWSNIVQPARHNFRKYNSFSVSDFGVGYDYDSVLHYSRRAFSANGQDTLVPKKSGAQIGQRVGLSAKDTQKLNKMYCDADNDPAVQADESTTKKPKNKKKPKNQPFEGHGIGYHQGKTVVIKLPAAETYKLPNVPSTHVFDFSKTPQVVPPEAEGYRFGEEITYLYKPITPNTDIIRDYNIPEVQPIVNKNTEQQHDTKEEKEAEPTKENNDEHSSPQLHSNEVKPEYIPIDDYDKDLKEAFDRLTKIVKQNIYPQNKGYDHKINKDYSKFFTPSQHQKSDVLKDYLNGKIEQPISYGPSTITPLKQVDITQTSDEKNRNNHIQDIMDVSFRTSLPTKKPYSSYEQTETPNYATLDYLKNRHDFSKLYSPNTSDYHAQEDGSIYTDNDKYKEDIKINPYDRGFYTDYVNKNINGRVTDAPSQENDNEQVKPSKYKEGERPKQLQLEEGIDSSYRTLFPTKKPYSAYEQTETPTYATLEYLKDRHDLSNIYKPNKSDNRKEPYNVSEDNHRTPKDDWYIKDSYRHNPVDYDRDSYSDYVESKYKKRDEYDDSDEDKESAKDSLNKTVLKKEAVNDNQNIYRDKENGKLTTDSNFNDGKTKAFEQGASKDTEEHDYFGKYKENDHSTLNEDDDYSKDSLHQPHEPLKYNQDYTTDYDKEHSATSVEASNEDENSK